MLDQSIHIKTSSFDGPLGLLLLLIEKNEMSIRDLNINKMTRQYLEYIEKMHELNFDVAGDYLYMAAVLLFLKSNSFVNEEEAEELSGVEVDSALHISSEAELVKRLQELKHYQELGQSLWALPKLGHEVHTKPKVNKKAVLHSVIQSMDSQNLVHAWVNFLHKENRKYTVVKKDRLSVRERLAFLKTLLKEGEETNFFEILKKAPDSDESEKNENTVMTFIALLELARLKKIGIFQNERHGNIFVKVKESLLDFDMNLAGSFGAPESSEQQAEKQALH